MPGRARRYASSALVGAITASVVALATLAQPAEATTAPNGAASVADYSGLGHPQRGDLMTIARDTWRFYTADVDPHTALPLDNLTYAGGSATPTATAATPPSANIGVYLWAVVSAQDLRLISRAEATAADHGDPAHGRARCKRYKGFLYQWYDTTDRRTSIRNPGDGDVHHRDRHRRSTTARSCPTSTTAGTPPA